MHPVERSARNKSPVESSSTSELPCREYSYISKHPVEGSAANKLSVGNNKSSPKQPSCKKNSAALRKAMVKKDVKTKVAAKKWL